MALSTKIVRPSTDNGPSGWNNIGNAYDSDAGTFAEWPAGSGMAQAEFDGFSHGIAAGEEIFSVKLIIKYSLAGMVDDFLFIECNVGGSTQKIWNTNGTNVGSSITDPQTFTIEAFGPPENPTDNIWTKTDFNNLKIIFNHNNSGKADDTEVRIYDVQAVVTYYATADISILSVFSTASLDGDINDSDDDGDGDTVDSSSANRWVGYDDTGTKEVYRSFDSFPITSLPAGITVEAATLEWTIDIALSDGTSSNADVPNLAGDLQVDHVNYGASLVAADWELSAITDHIADLFEQKWQTYGLRFLPDERVYGVESGVATAVQADFDAARTRSQFRMKYTDAVITAGASSDNYFAPLTSDFGTSPNSRYQPRLRIAYSTGLSEVTIEKSLTYAVVTTPVKLYYHFDVSDAGPTDASGDWSNDANAFDGSLSTYAHDATPINELVGEGTNAPGSGVEITQVRARIYGGSNLDDPDWGNYYTLTVPSGGWTWAKVQSLEVSIGGFDSAGTFIYGQIATDGQAEDLSGTNVQIALSVGTAEFRAYKVEIEVATGSNNLPQKSLKYSVVTTPSTITKSLEYAVAGITEVTIQKTLIYSVVTTPTTLTKSLKYTVISTPTTPTKSLKYRSAREIYSRENNSSLPANEANLTNMYTESDYVDVDTDNAVRVGQVATNAQYTLHLYKKKNTNNTDSINVTWNGKTDVAPSAAEVFLQIYNYNSTTWETLDSDSASGADADFNLAGAQTTSQSNYYDGDFVSAIRIYQLEPS